MVQKITLSADGVVQRRMRPATVKGEAKYTPAIRLSRLHQLLKSQCPSICIVRGEGLGDVIMTTPTIRALKSMFDKVEITYATNTRYLDGALVKVLRYNPDISHIIERDLMEDLAFDLVVNLHCPAVNHEVQGKIPPNRIDLFAAHAGVRLSDPVPKFYIKKEEVDSGEIFLKSSMEKLILVQPFSSSKARSGIHSTLKKSLISLYNDHGIRSVIITHSTDSSTDVLWNNIPGGIYLRDLDVRAIAGVMVHCDLVLCPDSSILHLAGCLDVPTVSLFGPTPPQSRINYYRNTVAISEAKFGPCPCWYSHAACPIRLACWQAISPDMIVDKCLEHLQNTSKVNIQSLLDRTKPIEIETEVI